MPGVLVFLGGFFAPYTIAEAQASVNAVDVNAVNVNEIRPYLKKLIVMRCMREKAPDICVCLEVQMVAVVSCFYNKAIGSVYDDLRDWAHKIGAEFQLIFPVL